MSPWLPGRVVVVGDGGGGVLGLVLLVDEDEEDELELELEELGGEGSGGEVGGVPVGLVVREDEDGVCGGVGVFGGEVGVTGDGSPSGSPVGLGSEVSGTVIGELSGEPEPWRLCSQCRFSSTSWGIAFTKESEYKRVTVRRNVVHRMLR